MCSYPTHVVQQTKISVHCVVAGNFAKPHNLVARRTLEIGSLIIDQHELRHFEASQIGDLWRGLGQFKLWDPCLQVVDHMCQHISLMVHHRSSQRRVKGSPSHFVVPKGPATSTRSIRQGPDDGEKEVKLSRSEQVQNGDDAVGVAVPSQEGETSLFTVFAVREVFQKSLQLLDATSGDPRGLEVDLSCPVLLFCSVLAVLRHQSDQRQRLIEVKDDELHRELRRSLPYVCPLTTTKAKHGVRCPRNLVVRMVVGRLQGGGLLWLHLAVSKRRKM
mmetsp:Transcript_2074/g.4808  ORF Transcript_2074/g.4808 Transcript_2074/m.4808 type:complete len:275 (-) Transcript_2074:1162-1986(-)